MDETMLRNMTAVYLMQEGKMLMLYRVGSRVVSPSWCGIGGHFENEECNDPKRCVLRELYEETGISERDIDRLRLKYIAMRRQGNEIRQNYYFFANMVDPAFVLPPCDEGTLAWVDTGDVLQRDMPVSARYCLEHFLAIGQYNTKQYVGVATEDRMEFVELTIYS